MALYEARWADPMSGRPKARTFHSKREADAFRDLPRDNFVFVARVKEVKA